MDSVGWHATHKADKDRARWSSPQRGPDGRYQPIEQIYPMEMPVPSSLRPSYIGGAPPPPPKDEEWVPTPTNRHSTEPPSPESVYSYVTKVDAGGQEVSAYPAHQLAHMSAAERARSYRVAQMEPPLQLMAGPLLRYDTVDEQGFWRGAALIVAADAGSSYEPLPMLTYSWDPDQPVVIARSQSQNLRGLSVDLGPHPADPMSTFSPAPEQQKRGPNAMSVNARGQEIYIYPGNGGTFTFWRFMIKIPLGPTEMKISYSVNRGQEMYFYVPARNQNMRWAAYSCNGFSAGVNPNDFCGPGFRSGYDPVWTDVLAKHAERPFHALIGGGDQLYCDGVVREPEMQEWVNMPKSDKKTHFPLSDEMRIAIDRFYFNHYCHMFRSGAFARANSSIPMLNMLDDHDLIDGFGSYPDELMNSPVFGTIGARGYFFFLLFQCFINVDVDGRDDKHHPFKSLVIGADGPFVKFPSHSFVSYLGPQIYMLLLDCRAERKLNQVCSKHEYQVVFERLDTLPPGVEHLVIQLGIPIAYPRMVFLEHMLESKMNPLVMLGRNGSLGLSGFVNKFNSDAELLDDLNDHWTATAHKRERNWFIEQCQIFAKARHIRVAFLSGDVHCAAVGVLKTLPKPKQEEVPPALDYRYMLNVVSSAIVNTPPPNAVLTMVSSLATKTHRTLHHLYTDESMIPLFDKDTNGQPPKSKYIMGRRNWCAVQWDHKTGDLMFDIRVEIEKGIGRTVGYVVRSPPPRWN